MPANFMPDADKPSVAIEIPLEKPLPDYDLENLEQPTPREVDGVLVSQGFRDLVDDSRGVLLEILCAPHKALANGESQITDLDLTPDAPHPMEIKQLTGAISTAGESYRPGLWIVLQDNHLPPNQPLSPALLDRVKEFIAELMRRMELS